MEIVKGGYFMSSFIRVIKHFHLLNFMNFISLDFKFIKFKQKIKFIKFELHNYGTQGKTSSSGRGRITYS